MKAVIYKKFGKSNVLEWVDEWPDPIVSPSHVLIKSIAGSVNPKDALLRKGMFRRTFAREPLPRVSGLDIAGEVVEVGTAVNKLLLFIGDRMTSHSSGNFLNTARK